MKTLKYSQDQFAKFLFRKSLKVKNYCFDIFYDIRMIMELRSLNQQTETPKKETFHLMFRDTGIDLVRPDHECYQTYFDNNTEVFELVFCWNSDYFFHNEYFCTIKRIK